MLLRLTARTIVFAALFTTAELAFTTELALALVQTGIFVIVEFDQSAAIRYDVRTPVLVVTTYAFDRGQPAIHFDLLVNLLAVLGMSSGRVVARSMEPIAPMVPIVAVMAEAMATIVAKTVVSKAAMAIVSEAVTETEMMVIVAEPEPEAVVTEAMVAIVAEAVTETEMVVIVTEPEMGAAVVTTVVAAVMTTVMLRCGVQRKGQYGKG